MYLGFKASENSIKVLDTNDTSLQTISLEIYDKLVKQGVAVKRYNEVFCGMYIQALVQYLERENITEKIGNVLWLKMSELKEKFVTDVNITSYISKVREVNNLVVLILENKTLAYFKTQGGIPLEFSISCNGDIVLNNKEINSNSIVFQDIKNIIERMV